MLKVALAGGGRWLFRRWRWLPLHCWYGNEAGPDAKMSLTLLTLALTVALEFMVYLLLVREKSWLKLLLYSLLVNSATQPLALALYQNGVLGWWVVEGLVIVGETFLLSILLEKKLPGSLRLSVIANSFSAIVGLLLFR